MPSTMPTHQHTASMQSVHSDDLRSLSGSRGLTTPSPAFDDSASASELGGGSTTAKKKRRKKKKRKKKATTFKGVSAADDDRVSDENGVSAAAVPHVSLTSPHLLITFVRPFTHLLLWVRFAVGWGPVHPAASRSAAGCSLEPAKEARWAPLALDGADCLALCGAQHGTERCTLNAVQRVSVANSTVRVTNNTVVG